MKKTKKRKFIIFLVLFALILSTVISIMFSNLLFFSLNGDTSKINNVTYLLSINGLFVNEEQRVLFLLCFLICVVTVIALAMMSGNKETFESDTTPITDTIVTPVAIGQGQYGTARWLRKEEIAKEYTRITIYPNDKEFMTLTKKASKEKIYILGGENRRNEKSEPVKQETETFTNTPQERT